MIEWYKGWADLPCRVERFTGSKLELRTASGYTRRTTELRLFGGGQVGYGEDIGFSKEQQADLESGGLPGLERCLPGERSLGEWSAVVAGLDLFPDGEPAEGIEGCYRVFGIESALLELAMKQSGEAWPNGSRSLRFVISRSVRKGAGFDHVERLLATFPGARFKLDVGPGLGAVEIARLREIGCVDVVDAKASGMAEGPVAEKFAVWLAALAEALPEVRIEDPPLTARTLETLAPIQDRITFDAPVVNGLALERWPIRPGAVHVKPARFGPLAKLLEFYADCRREGIEMVGGGLFELGPGRRHAQRWAQAFHPSAPNDLAPVGFHVTTPNPGLSVGPLVSIP